MGQESNRKDLNVSELNLEQFEVVEALIAFLTQISYGDFIVNSHVDKFGIKHITINSGKKTIFKITPI